MATLYAFYYVEKKTDLILLYAYTDDKELAKAFREMRNEKKLRLVKKKFDREDVENQIFYDPIIQQIYDPRYSRFRTKEISWHPLTDGESDYKVPLTYTEVTEISAKVDMLEDLAKENLASMEKSIFKPEVKKLIRSSNHVCKVANDECYSIINTLKIFADLYAHLLK